MIFQPTYDFFGRSISCRVIETDRQFSRETVTYSFIKQRWATWKYHRIDTTDQIGFPDVLLLKDYRALLIEGKLLKKKALKCIQDDIKFQPGQLPYMKRSLTLGLPYLLAVGKGNLIAFIGDKACLDNYL